MSNKALPFTMHLSLSVWMLMLAERHKPVDHWNILCDSTGIFNQTIVLCLFNDYINDYIHECIIMYMVLIHFIFCFLFQIPVLGVQYASFILECFQVVYHEVSLKWPAFSVCKYKQPFCMQRKSRSLIRGDIHCVPQESTAVELFYSVLVRCRDGRGTSWLRNTDDDCGLPPNIPRLCCLLFGCSLQDMGEKFKSFSL